MGDVHLHRPLSEYLEIEHIYSQSLGKGMRSIAVCAATSGEGVSTLACALAERHQKNGRETLLVDMNLYRPSIDQRFDLTAAPRALLADTTQAVVQVSPRLHIAPVDPINALRFRQQDVLAEAFRQWTQQYDAIVIDTSPLNAINRNNIPAEQVCACAEGVLMMVRSTITTESALLQAHARLTRQGANVLGVVLNDQDCPPLADELVREARRLDRWLPRASQWLIRQIRGSHFLNVPI